MPEAAGYLTRKMRRPNVVIYRDIFCVKRGTIFILRVRAADDREPDEQTMIRLNYSHRVHQISITGAAVAPEFPPVVAVLAAAGAIGAGLAARRILVM